MSQETNIDHLSGGISDEDAKLVDSILNDLGQGSPQQGSPQQTTPEHYQQGQQQQAQQQTQQQAQQQNHQAQPPQMTPQQQQQIHQQQMHQQQMMMQQQQLDQHQKMNQGPHMVATGSDVGTIADSIKREAKSIMVIIFLCIVFNLGQVDGLFKKIGIFVEEGGSLNMQCVFVKALLIATLFFLIKTQLL